MLRYFSRCGPIYCKFAWRWRGRCRHWRLNRDGQELVMKDGKYLPLTAAVVREERKKLD